MRTVVWMLLTLMASPVVAQGIPALPPMPAMDSVPPIMQLPMPGECEFEIGSNADGRMWFCGVFLDPNTPLTGVRIGLRLFSQPGVQGVAAIGVNCRERWSTGMVALALYGTAEGVSHLLSFEIMPESEILIFYSGDGHRKVLQRVCQ